MSEQKKMNKDAWVDWAICVLLGWLGVHKFREKKIGMGILYLITFGLFGIGWIVDVIKYLISACKGERICNKTLATGKSTTVKDNKKVVVSKKAKALTNETVFVPTKKVGNYFVVNENDKTWAVPTGLFKKVILPNSVHTYSEIVSFELLEDGNSITKGGLGRAVVGGALFGGVGAIVGGATGGKKTKGVCTKLQIKIILNNMATPNVYVDLINTSTKKDSILYTSAYSSAQEILSILQIICDQKEQKVGSVPNKNNGISIPEEIKKYKELLDMGAILEEEFENKKKELLNQ